MSDEFPSHSCADAFLFHGEVDEGEDRFLAFSLVSGRDHTMCEFLIRCVRESRALWTVMRVGLLIVAPGSDGERSGCSRRRGTHRTWFDLVP